MADFNEALKNAERGSVVSQGYVGWCYLYGRGTDVNYPEALRWLSAAAYEGRASRAFVHLGDMYAQGRGVVKSVSEAVRHYKAVVDSDCEHNWRWRVFTPKETPLPSIQTSFKALFLSCRLQSRARRSCRRSIRRCPHRCRSGRGKGAHSKTLIFDSLRLTYYFTYTDHSPAVIFLGMTRMASTPSGRAPGARSYQSLCAIAGSPGSRSASVGFPFLFDGGRLRAS